MTWDAGDTLPGKSREGEVLAERYRIVSRLGSGGMGTVYLAEHEVVGRRFAVKFLRSSLANRKDIEARFRREARVAGRLESEHIAAVVDYGVAEDGSPYLVMEYLEGVNLATLFASSGPLPVRRAASIVLQACFGVSRAHEAGVIHRDLKPANLFVSRRDDGTDRVKVLDFGVAKLDGDEAASTTKTGSVLGTPHYMSPEQARGDKRIDHRTDVYTLGVILYEALSGQKPHPGDGQNEVLYHIVAKEPTPLHEVRTGLPTGLVNVVERAMAPEPDARFPTAEAMAQALTPFANACTADLADPLPMDTLSADATVTSSEDQIVGDGSAPPTPRTASVMVTSVHTRRRPLASLAAVVVATVLVGAGLWTFGVTSTTAAPSATVTPASSSTPEASAEVPVDEARSASGRSDADADVDTQPEREEEPVGRPGEVSGRPETSKENGPAPVREAPAAPPVGASKLRRGGRSVSIDRSNPYE